MPVRKIAFGLLLASASTAALAQNAAAPANNPPPAAPAASSAASPSLSAEIASDLKKAGYTDVKVMPGSYIAQGKDKNGDAVTLFVGPGSITEVVMSDAATSGTASSPTSASMFTSVPAGDGISSKLVGTKIYNKDNKDIGEIKDVAFAPHGAVKAYILSVGGFLGMGEHYVAVRPSVLKLTWKETDKKWHAMLDTDTDSLKKAPEFKYP